MVGSRKQRSLVLLLICVLALSACGSDGASEDESAAGANTSENQPWTYVALGGSVASGAGSAYGEGYPDYFVELVEGDTDRDIEFVDLSIQEGGTAQAVLDLLAQPATVEQLDGADIVTMEIGGNDMIAGDEPYLAGECEGIDCYEDPLAEFEKNYEQVVTQIADLAAEDAALRAVTFYNPAIGDPALEKEMGKGFTELTTQVTEALNASTCRIAEAAGWLCVDTYQAFNGADGQSSPYDKELVIEGSDHMHPTEKGHRLIASLLLRAGYEPLI